MLCINKCSSKVITENIREELAERDSKFEKEDEWLKNIQSGKMTMEGALAQKFADALNHFYEKSSVRYGYFV